ncbi:MAG: CDP-alcohol phosphatidyltransferase family protein, partial [Gammaproteobacteria bacterium]|nr:CDP-alcohol phosphatidyltransferase family protein [Gammaproteobacteria bacterium]
MIEPYIRTAYDRFLVIPAAKRLIHTVSPNQITLSAGILGFMVFLALLIKLPFLAIMFLLLSG